MVKVWVRPPRTLLGEALVCSLTALGLAVVDDSDDEVVALIDLTAADLPLPPAEHPTAVALVCAVDVSTIRSAKRSGYRGLHPIHEGRDVLVGTLRAVGGGRDAIDDWSPRNAASNHVPHLTPRESEVLGLVMLGLPNKRIGRQLGIGERTVKHHVASIMRKYGVHDRASLIVLRHDIAAEPNAPDR
jgi:DNA-binding NarL/FixJ family response regulator